MNVFEGARRILKVGQVLVIAGGLTATWFDKPYLHQNYVISGPGAAPVRAEDCDKDSAYKFISPKLQSGREISVTLCFTPEWADNHERLIPFDSTKDGKLWLNAAYSSEVTKYTDAVGKSFQIPKEDQTVLEEKWSSERLSKLAAGAGWTLLAVALLSGFAWCIGWVVRGFIGIPSGMDSKPKENEKQQ